MAVAVGLAQLLAAVFPGTSRSAATILVAHAARAEPARRRPSSRSSSACPPCSPPAPTRRCRRCATRAAAPTDWGMVALGTVVVRGDRPRRRALAAPLRSRRTPSWASAGTGWPSASSSCSDPARRLSRAMTGGSSTRLAHDVVVIGGGNAALCAALAAREGGASVLVLEKAPEPERGGNSFFTAGGLPLRPPGPRGSPARRHPRPDATRRRGPSTCPPYTEEPVPATTSCA